MLGEDKVAKTVAPAAVEAVDRRDTEIQRRLAEAYQPMLRAMVVPATVYFAIVAIAYLIIEEPAGKVLLGTVSTIISLACFAISCECARKSLDHGEIERRAAGLLLMTLVSLVMHHTLHLEPTKLIFFALAIMIVSVVAISARLVIGAVVLAGGAMMAFAVKAGGDNPIHFGFILLAAAFVAFTVSGLTRKAILKAIGASITADDLREAAEKRAEQDILTGLPNRRKHFADLEKRLKARKGATPRFAVGIVDIDGFKTVNDRFGHGVGDLLLVEVSARLREACAGTGQLARLGGDEFALIIEDPKEEDGLKSLGCRIREAIGQPFTIMGLPLKISASAGFAMEEIAIVSASEMMERADYALFHAKEHGSGVEIYTAELQTHRREMNAIEHNLRHGDLEKEIRVVYQPQIDIRTGETVGFEALARWESRELGRVRPDTFIAVAERIGAMGRLTPLCLRKALEGARDWPPGLKLSFNLSVRDIETPASVETIRRIVMDSGFAPERLVFEVTETLIMSEYEQAQRSLKTLTDLGARVALDDFGVGYANFSHIDQLNIDTIKIDRSFVSRLGDNTNSRKIVNTMIDMCASLGVDCVVEGVETAEELQVLRSMGACYVQGYHFSRPIEAVDIPGYLMGEMARRVKKPSRAVSRAS
ncbi:putative bifunctional diguanylate cyclase/phosphodiesterase [Oricola thermophila]|uniref:EAL domain-containing protein n=1 Tax=Oricola thermophila TaxID=2742145 RepID=A0A6N1VJ47_9HYPH|nr:EAL domain-containing protein [Oricola thermophila]QKV20423.1 EAL domain-containing protein [Oricola thermophila]